MKVGLFTDKNAEKEAEAAAAMDGEATPAVQPAQPARIVPTIGSVVEARERRCCCGCSTRTGTIIIGTLSVIHGFMVLYLCLIGLNFIHGSGREMLGLVLMTLFGLVHVLTGMGLIYGADRGRPKMVSVWLFLHYAELGLYLGYFVISLGHMIYLGVHAEDILIAVASCILGTSLAAFCISIVRSFHLQLLSAETIVPLKESV